MPDAKTFEQASPWIEENLKRIKGAVKKDEPTGWYARLKEEPQQEEETVQVD